MAILVILEWENIGLDRYDEVIKALDYDREGEPGGIYHACVGDNGVRIIDVWDSPEALQTFTETRLGPVLGRLQLPPPSRQEVLPVDTLVIPPTGLRNAPPGAIRAVFDIPGASRDQYRQVIAGLAGAGLTHPDGRILHVAGPSERGWFVEDIWESREKLQAFAPSLLPLIAEAGIPTEGQPAIAPIHNTLIATEPMRNALSVRTHYIDLWQNGDLSVADRLYSADCVGHYGNGTNGGYPEFEKQAVAAERAALPDLRVTIEDQVAEGDKVVTRWRAQATNTGEIFGMPPTGRSVDITGIHIHRLENGKIVEVWAMSDFMGLMQQLGLAPSPEAAQV